MTINYGGYTFTEPEKVSTWSPPYRAGVYAVLIPDASQKPKPFEVIYFGESSNLSERGFLRSHHRYQCFIRQAGSEANLYIATYLMPNSTLDERRRVEAELISKYNPICNRT